MKTRYIIVAACLCVSSHAAFAQDAGFTWEGEVEFGIDSTVAADDPAAEFTDTYVSASVAFEAALSSRVSAFGELTLESVLDADEDRLFDDLGLYVSTLGLRLNFGASTVSVGKISPSFGVAWDGAPGFYGTALAEDYELAEMIGASVETSIGAGTLSLASFYVDNTGLSDSLGTKRGRVTTADGGAGNTGKLDNFAVQYTRDVGDTTGWIGARHLSAGQGDVSDETGIVAGISHDFGNGVDMIGEIAHFDGAGGSGQDATYLTVGMGFAAPVWVYSASVTLVENEVAGQDSLIALGMDRSLSRNIDVSFGIARFDVGGETSTALGVSTVFAF